MKFWKLKIHDLRTCSALSFGLKERMNSSKFSNKLCICLVFWNLTAYLLIKKSLETIMQGDTNVKD